MRKKILGGMLTIALLWNVSAEAQQKPRIQILVEELEQGPVTQASARCGITRSSLESIAALTLRNNGVLVTTDKTDKRNAYLYVSVLTLKPTTRSCVFATEVAVQGFSASDVAQQPIGGFKARRLSRTVLCDEHRIDMAPESEAGASLLRNVETMIKLCLGALEY